MNFAGFNYLAIPLAAFVSFMCGGIWYGALSKPWMAASGMTAERIQAANKGRKIPWPFVIAIVSQLVMAFVLAGLIGHLGQGQVTVWNGIISGAFVWLGFVATTLATNHAFQEQPTNLTLIDGGHWLVVLILQGTIIGWIGV
ncbi:MAG TPA: DUF1761 domain-containing protein [Hyphomicrobiaceae bacterium]|nr:DUF1761 domain-containing protein [Hyphomicrobiaceae bacterium]